MQRAAILTGIPTNNLEAGLYNEHLDFGEEFENVT